MENPSLEQLAENAASSLAIAEDKLVSVLSRVDARYLLLVYSRCRFFDVSGDGQSKYFRPAPAAIELAAWSLFPFFDVAHNRDPKLVHEGINAIEAFQEAYSFSEMFRKDNPESGDLSEDSLSAHLRLHSGIVRGSAYPIQIHEQMIGLFARFEERMRQDLGVGPLRTIEIVRAISFQMDANLRSFQERIKDLWNRCNASNDEMRLLELKSELSALLEASDNLWVPTFIQIAERLGRLEVHEWNAVAQHIGLTPSIRSSLSSPTDVQDRPVFFVESDRAYITQDTVCLDAIFNFSTDTPENRQNCLLNMPLTCQSGWSARLLNISNVSFLGAPLLKMLAILIQTKMATRLKRMRL